jgi:16S rRNA processing protein RimM
LSLPGAAAVRVSAPTAAKGLAPVQAPDQGLDWPADAIEVGRIVDAWGLKGAIKVVPFSKDPQALFSSRRWFLKPPDAANGPARGMATMLRITGAREQGDAIVATAHDLPDRTAAEALRQWRVFVSRGNFPTADGDEYYWVDLIGLAVVNRDGAELGRVIDLLDTGPHSVLRIAASEATPEAEQRLIPFVAAYVDEVSLAQGRIVVDWGLDY